jgi:protein-disulfide isomerase-like protein with CxxC motif
MAAAPAVAASSIAAGLGLLLRRGGLFAGEFRHQLSEKSKSHVS